tara:strand:- start:456 stop:722 length:267 start_codon:yes stop_codon:yes gene_type:complete
LLNTIDILNTLCILITTNKKGETMTKKDYIKMAQLIKDNRTMANLRRGVTHVIKSGDFMNELCEYFKNDNSNFNEIKFREATGEILGK